MIKKDRIILITIFCVHHLRVICGMKLLPSINSGSYGSIEWRNNIHRKYKSCSSVRACASADAMKPQIIFYAFISYLFIIEPNADIKSYNLHQVIIQQRVHLCCACEFVWVWFELWSFIVYRVLGIFHEKYLSLDSFLSTSRRIDDSYTILEKCFVVACHCQLEPKSDAEIQ